jgi:hypothetical protein
MASPLRDGSFDVAEIVLFATPSYSIWLGPPKVALAGVPLRQGQAGCLSGPNERWESACCGSWWSYQQAHPACTGSSHEKDRVAVQLERNHDSQHPLPGGPRSECHQSLGRLCSQDAPGRSEDQRQHRAQHRVPRVTAPRAGMFRRTPATTTGQSKAALAERSDRCPVRPTETAVNWRRSSRLEPADGPNTTGLSQGIWVRDDPRSS